MMNIGRTYRGKVPSFKQKIGQGSLSASLWMKNRTSMKKVTKYCFYFFYIIFHIRHWGLISKHAGCFAFCCMLLQCAQDVLLYKLHKVCLCYVIFAQVISVLQMIAEIFFVYCKYILSLECWIVMGFLRKLQRFIYYQTLLNTFSATQLILI